VNGQPSPEGQANLTLKRLIAFLSFLLVVIGQFNLFAYSLDENNTFPRGVEVTFVGILLFVINHFRQPTVFEQRVSLRASFLSKNNWLFASIVLFLLTTWATYLFESQGRTNYIPIVTLWLLSMGIYVFSLRGNTGNSPVSWREFWERHKSELLWLAGALFLGVALRFYQLGDIPRVVNGDEGKIGNAALNTFQLPNANPFTLWENVGALYLQFINFFLEILGVNPLGLRIAAAIGGVLAIPGVYLLGKQVTGSKNVGLIAACLIAISHTHVHFSRTVAVIYVQGTWLIPLELYFLLSGLQKRSAWRAALGGVLLGLHYNVYLSAQIMTGILLIYSLILFLSSPHPERKANMRLSGVFWGGTILASLPTLVNAFQKPGEFLNRLNADGTFQRGWLEATMLETGKSAFQILGERVIHAFLSLIYYPAIDFYGSNFPMLSLLSSTLFAIGVGLALWKTRAKEYLLLNGYFWGATFAIGIFATPPSADSYRMLIALPPAIIMAALGLESLLSTFDISYEKQRGVYLGIIGSLLASLLIFNTWVYFNDFAGQCRYGGDSQTRFASYLGNFARSTERESRLYLLSNDTFEYGTHPSVDFLSQNRKITNVSGEIDSIRVISGDILIANPDRIDELLAWADEHPGGLAHLEYDCTKKMLFSYKVP
jgi:4-amino-4-deoxy-L-arabinose transferase-like glycosyltransferase